MAPTAPSTTRWSQESVHDIKVATSTSSPTTIGRFPAVPTARMVACGGLITASKLWMPYMPRLEMEVVPPWYSCGASRRLRARSARSRISLEISDSDLSSAWRMMGVNSPPSMATATPTSEYLWRNVPASVQVALAAGTWASASASALMAKSLTDSL